MKAIRPVVPHPIAEPTLDINMGERQPEYVTLPVTAIDRGDHFVSLSRWELSEEERKAIAEGADLVHQVIHTKGAYPPMHIGVVPRNENPGFVRSVEKE